MKFGKPRAIKVCLDISATDTGMAVLGVDGNVAFYSHYSSKKGEDYIRLIRVADTIVNDLCFRFGNTMPVFKELYVYPEAVFMGKFGAAMIDPLIQHGILLAKLQAWAAAQHVGFFWNEISVGSWRSWLLKHTGVVAASRKSKDQKIATNVALAKLGYEVDNQNTADALGILMYVKEKFK